MVSNSFTWIAARVVRGHGVASGSSNSVPSGTIARQLPHFRKLGLELGDCWPGTLNLSVEPLRLAIVRPAYLFASVDWDENGPPETFSFSRCRVRTGELEVAGWIYYPHPETKPRHFQPPGVVEILAPWLPGIAYGAEVMLGFDPEEVVVAS